MAMFSFHFPPRTIGGRISLALNGTMISMFVLFLSYDIPRDAAERIIRKRTSLEEQAHIISIDVLEIGSETAMTSRLEELRRHMSETHSDSHIGAVERSGRLMQSGIAQVVTADVLMTVLRATQGPSAGGLKFDGQDFLFGSHSEDDLTVYVGEDLEEIRGVILHQAARRLGFIVISLLCGTVIMNIVLLLAIDRPIRAMEKAVRQIRAGNLGVQVESAGAAEFDTLAAAMNEMSRSLAHAEQDRAVQMRKACAIQTSLLPDRINVPGFDIARHCQPAETVGGDYYDVLDLPDGSSLLCIADVTGHGVSAALVASIVKTCILNKAEVSVDPGRIMAYVDRRLSGMNLPDMFVSMMLVRINEGDRELEYAGAGHPAAIIVDANGACRELASEGPLCGIGAGMEWETCRTPFLNNERLILYTDGITEASGPQPGYFGLERLNQLLRESRGASAKDSVGVIIESLKNYVAGKPANDDITILVVDRSSGGDSDDSRPIGEFLDTPANELSASMT